MAQLCICGSGKLNAACCERFLRGEALPKTPEQLMRSRYSAYALGNHGDYLLRTWFPATAGSLTAQALSERDREWVKLEVLARGQQGDSGHVEFKAWYRDQHGALQLMREKSIFQRIAGRWLYVGGEVHSAPDHS